MNGKRLPRYGAIVVILFLGVYWSISSAKSNATQGRYPKSEYLVTAQWLKKHKDEHGVVIVDVRQDKYFDGKLIPGAIRLPWGEFRYNNTSLSIGGLFVGPEQAQKALGEHGISRSDTIILYDSVERDGGATASYVFWILDLLGHEDKKILERGIDGWLAVKGELVSEANKLEPLLYQAPPNELRLRTWVDGDFIYRRLGDPHYQVLDVRSPEEYVGEKPNVGLEGEVLKLGHIPTAFNVDYRLNWVDADTKLLKPYPELQELYRGLDSSKGVVVYCHSGRRSSFSYFVLRLMGFSDVILYDRSWNEWGNPRFYFPVETQGNRLAGTALPQAQERLHSDRVGPARDARQTAKGGYVSCGG